MRHFKDENQNIRGIDADQEFLIKPEWVEMTAEEVAIATAPPPPPPPTAQEIRDSALSALVHEYADGRVIQCRPKDEQNMRNAIELLTRTGEVSTQWRMADNTVSSVTAAELEEAIISGQNQGAAIWAEYNASA